jgi:hypothetical protein
VVGVEVVMLVGGIVKIVACGNRGVRDCGVGLVFVGHWWPMDWKVVQMLGGGEFLGCSL